MAFLLQKISAYMCVVPYTRNPIIWESKKELLQILIFDDKLANKINWELT